jgi:hypothetical protein
LGAAFSVPLNHSLGAISDRRDTDRASGGTVMLSYSKRGKFSNPAQVECSPNYRVPAFFARSG